LAVYRLEPSEKEIHLNNERSELSKLAPTSDIAFHDQPPEHFFSELTDFRAARQLVSLAGRLKIHYRYRCDCPKNEVS
ncbi:hypothetical protein, partial [Lacticaseibacillus manihotivorans]|uniref:hypothetical protein n=1 Tax=Lacticaseibacillus manihotivorans TaxID=88233 RepID=UPI001F1596F2